MNEASFDSSSNASLSVSGGPDLQGFRVKWLGEILSYWEAYRIRQGA